MSGERDVTGRLLGLDWLLPVSGLYLSPRMRTPLSPIKMENIVSRLIPVRSISRLSFRKIGSARYLPILSLKLSEWLRQCAQGPSIQEVYDWPRHAWPSLFLEYGTASREGCFTCATHSRKGGARPFPVEGVSRLRSVSRAGSSHQSILSLSLSELTPWVLNLSPRVPGIPFVPSSESSVRKGSVKNRS